MGQMGSAPFASTRRRRRSGGAFSPLALYANGEAGGWYDPSDLTPEKVSWRRNLLTYSEQFDNSAWTKSNASILSNLLTWSQDFDNAAWSKVLGVTVAANTVVAPDGTTTADTVTFTASNANRLEQTAGAAQNGETLTGSIWLKGSGTMRIAVDTSTGIGGSTELPITLTSTWTRYTVSVTYSSPTGNRRFMLIWRTGDTATTVDAWGAQLVPGTTAQTYTPTTSAAAPIPIAAPNGTLTAEKIVENTATADHYIASPVAAIRSGVLATYSIYVKAAERTQAQVRLWGEGSFQYTIATFDLTTGTIIGSITTFQTTLASYEVTAEQNGWFRIALSCVFASGITGATGWVGPASSGSMNYAGNGASGIFAWGGQLEQSPTASSYQRITDFTSDFLAAFPTHALYQDSAGTTPVTALGQPVGLVLDKSKGGLASTTELFVNPDCTSLTGFSGAGANPPTLVFNNGVQATVTADDGASRVQTATISGFVVGRMYLVEVTVANACTKGSLTASAFTWGTIADTTFALGTTTKRIFVTATATSGVCRYYLGNTADNDGNVATFTRHSVREVPGAHAIQATSASRPTCDARVNLLTYSEQFDNAAWSKNGTTVTANTTVAPDGTTTGDTITNNAGAGSASVYQSITLAATSYTLSFSVRAGTTNTMLFGVVGSGFVSGSASILSGPGSVSGTGLMTLTGLSAAEWTRVAFTFSGTAIAHIVYFYPETTGTATGKSILLWGADLRLASDASLPYQRVVTASDYADVQAPRYLTFDGIDDSLYTAASVDFATWTSGTRRNLLTYPSAFDNAYWARTATTVSANNAVAPDGTQTADTLVETTAASTHSVYVNAGTYTGAYTQSVYVKPAGRTWVFLEPNGGSATRTFYNLSGAGSLGTVGTNVTASIAAVGNGWYRITATFTYAAAAAFISISLTTGDGVASYTGDGTSGVLLWGAQLELGSTATAFQDVGTDKMTVVTGVRKLSDAATGIMAEISANATANNGSFVLGVLGPATPYFTGSTGTVYQPASTASTTYSAPVTNVVTGQYDISAPSVILRANATQIGSNTSSQGTGTYGTYVLYVARRNNASLPFNGRIYQLIVRGAQTDTATVQQTERFVAGKTGITW